MDRILWDRVRGEARPSRTVTLAPRDLHAMTELERRQWIAPDGTRFRVTITEQSVTEGMRLRRIRRMEFNSLDGSAIGTTVVPGYLRLDVLDSQELEALWRHALGMR